MKLKRLLAAVLAGTMILTECCVSFAAEQENGFYQAGDIVIAINSNMKADHVSKENPIASLTESGIVFETPGELLQEGEDTTEEDSESETPVLLQQALAESETGYVDVACREAEGEEGSYLYERFYLQKTHHKALGKATDNALLGGSQTSYQKGQRKTFIGVAKNSDRRSMEIECLYIGEYCTVWCEKDSRYPEITMSEANAKKVADHFDMKWNDFTAYFGDYRKYASDGPTGTKDLDGDRKLAIVYYDMNQAYENAEQIGEKKKLGDPVLAGVFVPEDLFINENGNCMDCIHIDTVNAAAERDKNGYVIPDEEHLFKKISGTYSTLFHELQHLTEAAMTNGNVLPAYLDEAFAMAAEYLLSGPEAPHYFLDHFNKDYIYGTPLTMWCYYNKPMHSMNNYAASYLFGHYLRTRYSLEGKSEKTTGTDKGADVYGKILEAYLSLLYKVKPGADGYDTSDLSAKALKEVCGKSLDGLIYDFWTAVCIRSKDDIYGFSSDGKEPEGWSKEIQPKFETSLPTGKTRIYNGGAKFYRIEKDRTRITARENAEIFKTVDRKGMYTVEFKISTPSDAKEARYSTYQTITVNRGSSVDRPADPKPEDYDLSPEEYDFIGWFTDSSFIHIYDFDSKVEKDTVLYVGWYKKDQKDEIRITFDANVPEGCTAEGAMEPQSAESYQIFRLNRNRFAVKSEDADYRFVCWSTKPNPADMDSVLCSDEEEVVFSESTKLYAVWEEDYDVIVTFDANGGKTDQYFCLKEGEAISAGDVDTPKRTGYYFCGWWTMEDGKYTKRFTFDTPVTEDLYLYARWTAVSDEDSSSGSTPAVIRGTGIEGTWAQDADGNWSCTSGGKAFVDQWAYLYNPWQKAGLQSQWFFFDANGKVLCGWQWIKGSDGLYRCYWLNPNHDGAYGACQLGGTTPDGHTLSSTGAWTQNGTEVTKKEL